MATTTTNYGFDVPTSSDLVKNGATAISTLGQDLDTFLFRPFTRNGVLNSGFNVWQRGTSVAQSASSTAYHADRWASSTPTNGATTISRQLTADTTNLPFIQYCARVQRNSGQTGTAGISFQQNIETVNSIPYAGKTITMSFYARAGANYSPTGSALGVFLFSGTGTDQNIASGFTGQLQVINQTATLTTTWQRFTYTATVGSTVTQLCPYFLMSNTGTAGANDYYEITGVQLEVGSQNSPYAPATPTYATELAACQRYYQVVASGTQKFLAPASVYTSGQLDILLTYPEMRIAPSLVATSGSGYYLLIRNGGSDPFNSITLNGYTTPRGAALYNNTEISSTAGNAGWVYLDNASASVALSAEL